MRIGGSQPRSLATTLCLVASLAAGLALACDQPRSSARPSPSLVEIDVSRPPGSTTPAQSAEPTPAGTFVAIPVGWETSFCGILADAVVAQELVIDIERALNEDEVRDARGLTRELAEITADATGRLTQVPAWDAGAEAIQRLGVMIDLGTKVAEQYAITFDQRSESALRKAHGFRRDLGRETPATNEALTRIANVGISCDGAMQLETF